jgi:hypothetical protein
MFERFNAQIRDSLKAGAGLFLVLVPAAIGLVWLSIAAVGSISIWAGPIAAQTILGAIGLAPVLVVLIARFAKAHERRGAVAPARLSGHGEDDFALIARAAENLVEKAPLAAIAVAVLGGVFAVRSPSALALLVQMLDRPARA